MSDIMIPIPFTKLVKQLCSTMGWRYEESDNLIGKINSAV